MRSAWRGRAASSSSSSTTASRRHVQFFLWAMRNMLLPMHQSGAWPAGSCNRCASVSTCHMCHKAACFGCAPHAAGVHFPGGRQDLHRRAVLVAAQAVSTWVNRIGVCVVQSAVAVVCCACCQLKNNRVGSCAVQPCLISDNCVRNSARPSKSLGQPIQL